MFLQRKREQADVRMTDIPIPAWAESGPSNEPISLVFLHGIGGGKKGFQPSLDFFSKQGYRALAWDMPGYGESALCEPFDFPILAQALESMLNAAHVQQAVLIGHSMGAMGAVQAWTHCPQRSAALVLAASSPAFGNNSGEFQQQFMAQRLAPLDAGQSMAQVADRLIPGMVAPGALPAGAKAADYPPGLALAHACMSAVPAQTYRAALKALVTFEQRAALPSLSVPTLCLAGEVDRTAPPEVMRRMAEKIPHAEFESLPGTGHLMGFEQPELFHAAVLNFLSRKVQ